MKRFVSALLLLAVLLGGVLPLSAQQNRVSPHEIISRAIDGNRITVVYGRPYSKNPKSDEIRKIWGGLVPYGKVWRMGADEATLLITQQPIMLGDTMIPAGAYTLFALPNEAGSSKLIVNRQIGQWGLQYDAAQDLARIDLKKDPLEKTVGQFTMVIDKNPAGGGVLKLQWENTQFSVPFTVKK